MVESLRTSRYLSDMKLTLAGRSALASLPPLFRALWAAVLISVTAGCGHLTVATDLDVQITGRDAAGRVWRSVPEEFTRQPPHPQGPSPFPNLGYEGKLFEWLIVASPGSFGYMIRNKVSGPLCFRFDEALLTSNMQPKEIPMRVYSARLGPISKPTLLIPYKGKGSDRLVSAPPMCFMEKQDHFSLGLHLDELFPSGNTFNIRVSGNDTTLLDRGIGNWLKIRVPIEYQGKREELEITLTAKDSVGVLSYW